HTHYITTSLYTNTHTTSLYTNTHTLHHSIQTHTQTPPHTHILTHTHTHTLSLTVTDTSSLIQHANQEFHPSDIVLRIGFWSTLRDIWERSSLLCYCQGLILTAFIPTPHHPGCNLPGFS